MFCVHRNFTVTQKILRGLVGAAIAEEEKAEAEARALAAAAVTQEVTTTKRTRAGTYRFGARNAKARAEKQKQLEEGEVDEAAKADERMTQIQKFEATLTPRLELHGWVWGDVLPVLSDEEIVDDLGEYEIEIRQDINGFFERIVKNGKADSEIAKKAMLAIAKHELLNRLHSLGLMWSDVLPLLEKLDVAEVRKLAKKGNVEKRFTQLMNLGTIYSTIVRIDLLANSRSISTTLCTMHYVALYYSVTLTYVPTLCTIFRQV